MAKSLLRADKEIAEIYERHVNTVYRVCFSYMKNCVDTEDMVQETFLRLLRYNGGFESPEHEKAWLIVTSANLCKDSLKRIWRKKESIRDYADLREGDEDYSEFGCPFETDFIFEAIKSLPDKLKTTVYLYYYEGYNSAQIARMLKKPQSTIRNQLLSARKKLKQILGGEFDEPEDI